MWRGWWFRDRVGTSGDQRGGMGQGSRGIAGGRGVYTLTAISPVSYQVTAEHNKDIIVVFPVHMTCTHTH